MGLRLFSILMEFLLAFVIMSGLHVLLIYYHIFLLRSHLRLDCIYCKNWMIHPFTVTRIQSLLFHLCLAPWTWGDGPRWEREKLRSSNPNSIVSRVPGNRRD